MASSTQARDELPPCPPRERGEPKPAGCLDLCPQGLVSTEQGCTLGSLSSVRVQSSPSGSINVFDQPMEKRQTNRPRKLAKFLWHRKHWRTD
jgi:hypothetical protein